MNFDFEISRVEFKLWHMNKKHYRDLSFLFSIHCLDMINTPVTFHE